MKKIIALEISQIDDIVIDYQKNLVYMSMDADKKIKQVEGASFHNLSASKIAENPRTVKWNSQTRKEV